MCTSKILWTILIIRASTKNKKIVLSYEYLSYSIARMGFYFHMHTKFHIITTFDILRKKIKLPGEKIAWDIGMRTSFGCHFSHMASSC